ncbi:MAG: hypothetical protein HN337_03600 [Deltaproteobacteria bacterium]|jgi:hypothetical protein|nr:hypothetical protein [Deltaproteobacteria bacterium]
MQKSLMLICCTLMLVMTIGCSEKDEVHYTYLDGSGNKYILSPDGTLEYDPVSTEESSSGEYSGGKPVIKKIKPTILDNIKSTINIAIENKDVQISKRVKMSGFIEVRGGKKKNVYILSPSSEEKSKIEITLKAALTK